MSKLLSLVSILPLALWAQEYRGTVLGRVSDPTGAVVGGAAVEVRNIGTNTVSKAVTNESGNYQIPFSTAG
jgi:Carboxypeptidase regulatory-like domain